MTITAVKRRTVSLRGSLDLRLTLRLVQRGGLDPTTRLTARELWRATRMSTGPATLHVVHHGTEIEAEAWGPGADEALDGVPALVGATDDAAGFEPRHPLLLELARRLRGMRVCRTGAVTEALVPTVLEQKVQGVEARRSYRGLVRRLGEPAPGPASLRLPPRPEVLMTTPSWVFHRFNVEGKRAETIRRVASVAARLDEGASLPLEEAYRRIRSVPGLGAWSAAEVGAVALGDADAVSVGDFHLSHMVCWALAGEPRGDDARMLELLEPWAGHRGRVIRLLEAGGVGAPRFGPRLPRVSIAGL
jgi:3-methyladenine DNA glycosylase/8-oxoguanine DNA glycosylase